MATVKIIAINNKVNKALDYITDKKKTLNKEYESKNISDDTDWASGLMNALNYIENDEKTNNKYFVTGINCQVENAFEQMESTKERYGKTTGKLAYHIIQSFDENEITPDIAHKIGVEFVEEIFGDRFEAVVSTHTNTKHYHNHIVVNSVSFRDGMKYYDNHENYSVMRKVNDNLAKSYNLKVLDEKKCKGSNLNYDNFYKKYERKHNYKNSAKYDIDLAIKQSFSFEDFKEQMKRLNYEVSFRYGKMNVRELGYKRNIRVERAFGENYSVDRIKERILSENMERVPFIECYKFKKPKILNYPNNHKYKKQHIKPNSLKSLYYHYCFLLKVYPKTYKRKTQRVSNLLKEEVLKLEMYSNHAKFISHNNLDTNNDLSNLKDKLEVELEKRLSEREMMKMKKKTFDDIKWVSKRINEIKNDLKTIEEIEDRLPKIKEYVKKIDSINKEIKKDRNKNINLWRY